MATEDDNRSTGVVTQAFADVQTAFDQYLQADDGYSAQLCIYLGGEPVVDLVGGPHLRGDSLTGVYSATKGAAALAVASVIDAGALDLEALVIDYWPELGAYGKATVTVGDLPGSMRSTDASPWRSCSTRAVEVHDSPRRSHCGSPAAHSAITP